MNYWIEYREVPEEEGTEEKKISQISKAISKPGIYGVIAALAIHVGSGDFARIPASIVNEKGETIDLQIIFNNFIRVGEIYHRNISLDIFGHESNWISILEKAEIDLEFREYALGAFYWLLAKNKQKKIVFLLAFDGIETLLSILDTIHWLGPEHNHSFYLLNRGTFQSYKLTCKLLAQEPSLLYFMVQGVAFPRYQSFKKRSSIRRVPGDVSPRFLETRSNSADDVRKALLRKTIKTVDPPSDSSKSSSSSSGEEGEIDLVSKKTPFKSKLPLVFRKTKHSIKRLTPRSEGTEEKK